MTNKTQTLDTVTAFLRPKVLAGNTLAARWLADITSARLDGKRVSVSTWLQNHDSLETLQATVNEAGDTLTGAWTPGPREVDTESRKGGAFFDSSFREYASLVCIRATDSVWLGYNADMRTLVVYSAL